MTFMRVNCMLQGDSLLAEDQYINTFHFDTSSGGTDPETDFDAIATDLIAFYQGFDGYLSLGITTTIVCTGYDLADPEPRAPINTMSGTLTLSASGGLPAEVALCMSFEGERVSGVPQSRRRGRVYIGPLASNALGALEQNSFRPDATFVNQVVAAGLALQTSTPTGDWWSVYSPTIRANGGSLADAMTPVENGWVDNAWDIQRRRGKAPTSRTTWT